MCEDTLCLKTEYGYESYIVSSGEYFWGGAKTREQIGNVLVLPIPDKVVSSLENDFARNMEFAIKEREKNA